MAVSPRPGRTRAIARSRVGGVGGRCGCRRRFGNGYLGLKSGPHKNRRQGVFPPWLAEDVRPMLGVFGFLGHGDGQASGVLITKEKREE